MRREDGLALRVRQTLGKQFGRETAGLVKIRTHARERREAFGNVPVQPQRLGKGPFALVTPEDVRKAEESVGGKSEREEFPRRHTSKR